MDRLVTELVGGYEKDLHAGECTTAHPVPCHG
jgi:hypothetical protein